MQSRTLLLGAVIGSTLAALLLTGSSRVAATPNNLPLPPALVATYEHGKSLLAQGRYQDARGEFLRASQMAGQLGLNRQASMNLSNVGACDLILLNFKGAERDFQQAGDMARASGENVALSAARNNLASLYIHMHQPEKALQVATAALAGREGRADPQGHGRLLFQRADALAEMNRLSEAEPLYRQAFEELSDLNDFDSAARIEGKLGLEYLRASRRDKASSRWLDDAESVLSDALWLVRIHHLNASANVLSALAELKGRRGDTRSAAALFEAALNAPPGLTPVWLIRSRRAAFRLEQGDLSGALDDFREARRTALIMRADMVPADQDRIALESSDLGLVMEGLVEAGNRLARETGDRSILSETFDVAEQDRMWSLRALVPGVNDWRSRLPEHYWELLAQFQGLERTAVASRSAETSARIERLRQQMQMIEAAAGGESQSAGAKPESALRHAQILLDDDSVLFSFLLTKTSAWVWAVDRSGVDAYPLPRPEKIASAVKAFNSRVRRGDFASAAGADLYRDLFGALPEKYRNRKRWLIEPDGALNQTPFAALSPAPGEFLVQRAAVESIPGALLLERGTLAANSPFLGVGDPIYNSADSRYGAHAHADLTLPRLPNTAAEVEACSRAWGGDTRLLTGSAATAPAVEAALGQSFGIVHFATHVITEPGEFRSGMIALSLDSNGGMGLLGPKDIVARQVKSSLIVMNGCHSAQGEALHATGLMGLTRAWIGAGAQSVISTQWDIPDDVAQSLISDFYRALHDSPAAGAASALREAQLRAIRRTDSGRSGSEWAAYSLLSRLP